jgi:hypothetical protein
MVCNDLVNVKWKGIEMTIPKSVQAEIAPIGGETDSLLLVCPSFEDRSTHVAERLSKQYRTENAFIFLSTEFEDKGKTRDNYLQVLSKVADITLATPEEIRYLNGNPLPAKKELYKRISDIEAKRRITHVSADITTFTRQFLLMIMDLLCDLPEVKRIRLFYSEPNTYDTVEDRKEGWLSRGVKSIAPVPGFSGVQTPDKSTLLILFLGHELERANVTIKWLQPSKIVAFIPDVNYSNKLDGIVETIHQDLIKQIPPERRNKAWSARDIEEAYDIVSRTWSEYHDSFNIIVAPYNTKLLTLGVFESSRERRGIQIIYALPAEYNYNNYSKGKGPLWEIPWM